MHTSSSGSDEILFCVALGPSGYYSGKQVSCPDFKWSSVTWSSLLEDCTCSSRNERLGAIGLWDKAHKVCSEQVRSTSHLLHKMEWRTVWIFGLLLTDFRGWWTILITPRHSYFCAGKSLLWPLSKHMIQFGNTVKREDGYLWSVWTLRIEIGRGWQICL